MTRLIVADAREGGEIAAAIIADQVAPDVPASIVQRHPDAVVIADPRAAALVSTTVAEHEHIASA